VLYALLLVVMMLTRPQGLLGSRELRELWRRKKGTGA
jgi:ABC-type branched-subunit amino acid transport system permease subunit